jgi:uncharacterized protein
VKLRAPAIVGLLGAIATLSCSSPNPPAIARRTIHFATGASNGPFRSAGEALVNAYRKRLPEYATDVTLAPAGGVDTIRMLQQHEAEIGFAYADVAYAGFVGKLPDQPVAFEDLRGIALLQRAVLHVVAGPVSVRRVTDLRGRTADYGGGAGLALEAVLSAFGLRPNEIVAVPRPDDTVVALQHRRLDAMFVLGLPPVAAVQAAIDGGAHLVPVDGAPVEQLLRQYPFYSPILVRPHMYRGLPAPIATIGINGVLLCRDDLDDDLVYRLTKALYEGPSESQSSVDPSLAPWLDLALGGATPVPLHRGAARYYRERELAR